MIYLTQKAAHCACWMILRLVKCASMYIHVCIYWHREESLFFTSKKFVSLMFISVVCVMRIFHSETRSIYIYYLQKGTVVEGLMEEVVQSRDHLHNLLAFCQSMCAYALMVSCTYNSISLWLKVSIEIL